MKTMRAAVFEGDGILRVREVPVPKIQKQTQVLIRVKAASICGSDIHGLMVPPAQYLTPGIVMGHEFYGEIAACGTDVEDFEFGDCVAVNPAVPCGQCYECMHGREEICDQNMHYGQTCDGGFAEYVVVESGQLHKVPKGTHPDAAAQMEPLACIMGGISRLRPQPEEYLLLYGAGPIGLMYIKVLKALGIQHIAVCAKGEKRIGEALRFGAETVVDIQKEKAADKLMRVWGQGPDVVIDAVGTGQILEESLQLINSGGRILLFGFNKTAASDISPSVFCVKELQVAGSRNKNFPAALNLMDEGNLNLEELVSHRLPLSDINRGMELMRSKEAARVIIYP